MLAMNCKHIPILLFTLLSFYCLGSLATSDLNSDKQALLSFAAKIPHGRRLNWDAGNPVCTSWIGVKCSADGTRVRSVRIPGIGLYGPIPENVIGKLDALQVLSLRSNQLLGNLPSDITSLPSLRYLYLQFNNFSGKIPNSLSSTLIVLDLSYNSFEGEIPPALQNLTQVSVLNLQNNNLFGLIPNVGLPTLKHLNLSYNPGLNGSIPQSLQRFSNNSFIGNSLLCGSPLVQCSSFFPSPPPSIATAPSSKEFPPVERKVSPRVGSWAIIATSAGGLAVLLLLAMVTIVCMSKTKHNNNVGVSKEKGTTKERVVKAKELSISGVQDAEKNKLTFFEGCSYSFDLEDLLRASAEVLGRGTYGTSYKAILEDGVMVVVKRLKEVAVGKRDFEQQMEAIGRVGQHPNIMPLRAYYYSKDERLLVSDFAPNSSLSALLHGIKTSGKTPLNWDSRVKISLGTAHAIVHLHSKSGGKLVHGNIKSSNVLVSDDFEPRISDFGIAPIMHCYPRRSHLIVGYHAPEVLETRKGSQKSDVYSFGVLLLELLTGKCPTQSPGRNEVVDLPRWVKSVVREEWTSEVFDPVLLRHQHAEEDMVQMLQIAMSCIARSPDQRPKMEDVVTIIEDIWKPIAGSRSSTQ